MCVCGFPDTLSVALGVLSVLFWAKALAARPMAQYLTAEHHASTFECRDVENFTVRCM